MRISKYFKFTIQGDNLNPVEIANTVDLPCEIYMKGEKTLIGPVKKEIIQKTNRWVYFANLDGKKSTNYFIKQHLEKLVKRKTLLDNFIKDYYSNIEIILYAGNKTNITLSVQHIKLLNELGVNFSISFC